MPLPIAIVRIALLACVLSCIPSPPTEPYLFSAGRFESLEAYRSDAPEVSWESIHEVLHRFDIPVPSTVGSLEIDPNLVDRGRTLWRPQAEKLAVTLGPNAFASWALLGSTIGHEIEVHARQDMKWISLLKAAGLPAIEWAERKAYQYELDNADRFGLSESERHKIQQTLNSINNR